MVRKKTDVKRPQMIAETSASGGKEYDTIYIVHMFQLKVQKHTRQDFMQDFSFNIGRGSIAMRQLGTYRGMIPCTEKI